MRMWNISPEKMCNNHLLGEHLEIHMFVSCLNKGKKIDGYIKKGLLEIHNLKKRHNQLVKEMKKRGMNHKSPLKKFKRIKLGKINLKKNEKELFKRCKKCRKIN